jgi:hypothetical protein
MFVAERFLSVGRRSAITCYDAAQWIKLFVPGRRVGIDFLDGGKQVGSTHDRIGFGEGRKLVVWTGEP